MSNQNGPQARVAEDGAVEITHRVRHRVEEEQPAAQTAQQGSTSVNRNNINWPAIVLGGILFFVLIGTGMLRLGNASNDEASLRAYFAAMQAQVFGQPRGYMPAALTPQRPVMPPVYRPVEPGIVTPLNGIPVGRYHTGALGDAEGQAYCNRFAPGRQFRGWVGSGPGRSAHCL